MLAAAFSIFGWSTNFRLRSAYYSEIMGAGPGKDDILPTDRPVFETAGEAEKCLTDREPVQVVNVTGDSRAYPLQIMIWHEVVNDTVGGSRWSLPIDLSATSPSCIGGRWPERS